MKKYIVITGASSGIGAAAAVAFAERGKNLILIARRTDKLQALKKRLNEQFPLLEIVLKPFDLTALSDLENFFYQLDEYFIEGWINNAGFGYYTNVSDQKINRTLEMLKLNIDALTILSILYVQKYEQQEAQLINLSSAGGYTMVPTAVTYCASKFYVSAFTEGLALELQKRQSSLQVKVLAPAATNTEFGKIANSVETYDYDKAFGKYHHSKEMAEFLLELYDSKSITGYVDRTTFQFELSENKFAYASTNNQKSDEIN